MKKFLMRYYMNNVFSLPLIKILFFLFIVAIGAAFFSMPLAAAILFAIVLFSLTLALLLKFKVGTKELFLLLLVGFLIHGAVLSLIYFSGFRPVGGGADYETYHSMAKEIAQRTWVGNFSLEDVRGGHDFTVLVGAVYFLFYPDMLVANVLIIWFFCLSLIFTYLLIIEMGGSSKTAILAGLLVSLYPSYVYFGNLLLKDTLVIPLVLFAMLIGILMLREFSWPKFLLFFIILTSIIHLRFYIGYALMFSFVASWFLVSSFDIKKRLSYGLGIVFLLGFSPLTLGNGYYGAGVLKEFVNWERITIYREIAYNPASPNNETENPILPGQPIPESENRIPESKNQKEVPVVQNQNPAQTPVVQEKPITTPVVNPEPSEEVPSGLGSSFVVETGLSHGPVAFIKGSLTSFMYGLLGPFSWQLRYHRQQVALFETIPWYIMLAAFLYGFLKNIKEKNATRLLRQKKRSILFMIFAVLAIGGLSLFINNYGIIMRIRIPVFISLIIAGCAIFNNYLEMYIQKIYEKISRYGWSRLYPAPPGAK